MELLNCRQKSHQIYTIHIELSGFAPPWFYVLLPNKTEEIYNRMIELLSEETNPNPGKILTDFEKEALNAFSKKFSHAAISCCYFHLTHSFNRKINEIGLKTYYESFPEFNFQWFYAEYLVALAELGKRFENAEV